jgi:hypothetical protein
MAQTTIEIDSVAEFLVSVGELKLQWEVEDDAYINPWFRGQPNAAYGLVPGVYRFDPELGVDEDTYRHDFKLKSHPYLQGMRATTDWEEYALMQHYGLPTRLLDWTEGALIALQFAVLGRCVPHDIAVWMIEPQSLNKSLHKNDALFRPDDALAKRYLPPVWAGAELPGDPLAVEVPYNSPRITAQRGIFTVHGSNRRPLEDYFAEHGGRCCQFVVRRANVLDCRRQLRAAGISDTVIYPDLSGLCEELWHTWVEERVVTVE